MSTPAIIELTPVERSGTATDQRYAAPIRSGVYGPQRAQLWRATLGRAVTAMAEAEAVAPVTLALVQPADQDQLEARPGPSREAMTVRLACLKAAAEYLAARPETTPADVQRVAESWASWVTR